MRHESYLDLMQRRLIAGVGLLPREFLRRQADFILSRQAAARAPQSRRAGPASQSGHGGFRGRGPHADIYYTRFALQTLALLAPVLPARARAAAARPSSDDYGPWARAAGYLRRLPANFSSLYVFSDRRGTPCGCPRNAELAKATGGDKPRPYERNGPCRVSLNTHSSLVEAMSFLHGVRLLEAAGSAPFRGPERDARLERVARLVSRCRNKDGGYSNIPGAPSSVYHVFLAALCYELLGRPTPRAARAAEVVLARRRADGGFADMAAGPQGQTNATAAAVAFLAMAGRLDEAVARGAAAFLESMQAPEGGLKAHASAAEADLLSTFTGLWTLALLAGEQRCKLGERGFGNLRLAPLGRFVRSLAARSGGFRGSPGDRAADVEYTFYGLGSLALLAQAAQLQKGK